MPLFRAAQLTCMFTSVKSDQQTTLILVARRCLSVLALRSHTSTARMARCPSPSMAMAQLTRVGVAHIVHEHSELMSIAIDMFHTTADSVDNTGRYK